MNAYYGGLKIYEVLGYMNVPEELVGLMGEQIALVRFGSELGTPLAVRTDDIEIRD